jgi:hypothetical protein
MFLSYELLSYVLGLGFDLSGPWRDSPKKIYKQEEFGL